MTENNFNEIFELDKFMDESENFKNNKPFKFTYVENIFKPDFYQKLHDGYPDEENDMLQSTQFSKNSLYRGWANMYDVTENENAKSVEDPKLNQQWNTLVEYNKSKDVIHLKESMDKFAISIPIMFTMGIANGMWDEILKIESKRLCSIFILFLKETIDQVGHTTR